jgi:GH43 family beta-xylosidase
MPHTYSNPVYPDYLADPFVLRHRGTYYAYGTAPHSPDGWPFPVLRSDDLVTWEKISWALKPVIGATAYWAPEVAENNGTFYLYYSARGIEGRDHQLRIATSLSPAGPFEDIGLVLTPDDPFTIDAHPFVDADGQRYLFYARDFLTLDGDQRAGTGVVVDRLRTMTTLEGHPQVVVRPYADWHLFQAQRPMYGGVYDWHTIEGPAVLRHEGRYYCFFSGGAWEKDNYGVAYVVAEHPLGPYTRPALDTPLLCSVPNRVIGPGHNSFVRSPDGMHNMIAYHAWSPDRSARRMCIDRLIWRDGEPVIHGPTWTPQTL